MDALLEEAESLEAILMEDVKISRNPETNIPELMETTILNDNNLQITLQVIPSESYPDVSPLFKLLRPRGLDDQRLDDIKKACIAKLEESVGFPVVFDLIEVIREHMTQSNLPSGQCVVCLYGFEEGDEFTKTSCFHYLHSYCLARHLAASKKNYEEEQDKLPSWLRKTSSPYQPNCPVCREPIEDCSESLKNSEPPAELNNAPEFELSEDLRQLQLKMASLFLIQKSKGAIIDVDAENSGNLISIQTEEEARLELERKKAASETNGHYENGLENGVNDDSENGEEEEEEEEEDDCANYSQNYTEYFKNFNNKRSNKPNSSEDSSNNTTDPHLQTTNGATMPFAPNVQQSQRIADPTNNNYDRNHHYNRRHHYRGGRRHQYHKHRYDRYESSGHQNDAAATGESQKGQCANTSGNSR